MKRCVLLALLAALFAAPPAEAEVLQFADRFRMVTVSDPQIAPDGHSVAVVVSRANLKLNRFDTEVAVVDVAGGAPRPVTFERRGAAQPRWAPDGSSLAFLARVGD